jgi:hypothetical protein
MSTTSIIVLNAVAAAVLLLIAVVAAWRARRRAQLRDQFGSEYDRAVDSAPNRRTAERDLRERADRREQLDIRPLAPESATRYRDEWRVVQERFVDTPAESVAQAHSLVTAVMRERGYPTTDDEERTSMLSVDHADVMDHYRSGMRTQETWRANGQTDTEDLRLAMQHYREVFDRLVAETDTGADAYPADTTTDSTDRSTTGARRRS